MSPGVSLKPQKFLYQSLRRNCILSELGIRYEIIPIKRKTEVIYISSEKSVFKSKHVTWIGFYLPLSLLFSLMQQTEYGCSGGARPGVGALQYPHGKRKEEN